MMDRVLIPVFHLSRGEPSEVQVLAALLLDDRPWKGLECQGSGRLELEARDKGLHQLLGDGYLAQFGAHVEIEFLYVCH